jgi:N-acetylglucosaminyldiphosphoundecaprenol N-acetyl-beta-D-mannosaminyltransferase
MSSRAFRAVPCVQVMGMPLARLGSAELLEHITDSIDAGLGGWLVTANLDILLRHTRDPGAKRVYSLASLRVADGMPLIWASRLQREPLPERIAGSSFMYDIAERCAVRGWSVFLLGGSPGSAESAAQVMRARYPQLQVDGCSDLNFSNTPKPDEVEQALSVLGEKHRVILVGLGSPKQEFLIEQLRARLPSAWLIGIGGSFSFVAGTIARAPDWAQKLGLEWAHRLAQEPRRLGRRYLLENLPFFGRLVVSSLAKRYR